MLEEFEDLDFGSEQLEARFVKTMKTLSKNPEKSIYGSSEKRSEAKAIYRLLGNGSFNLEEVKRSHKASTIKRIKDIGGVVLAVQDTSSINYNGHKKTKDLGQRDVGSTTINQLLQ
ncbi:hypothetical protein FACS1894126_4430 [Alphaproteobacteria bacterium]|nr:hypothetical protein FACS1894126_4430 [Alphaproteobacteria bacterium]